MIKPGIVPRFTHLKIYAFMHYTGSTRLGIVNNIVFVEAGETEILFSQIVKSIEPFQ